MRETQRDRDRERESISSVCMFRKTGSYNIQKVLVPWSEACCAPNLHDRQ